MQHDHHRCAICAAEFASTKELIEHEKTRHTQHGVGGISPSNEYVARDHTSVKPRQNRKFTRRNFE